MESKQAKFNKAKNILNKQAIQSINEFIDKTKDLDLSKAKYTSTPSKDNKTIYIDEITIGELNLMKLKFKITGTVNRYMENEYKDRVVIKLHNDILEQLKKVDDFYKRLITQINPSIKFEDDHPLMYTDLFYTSILINFFYSKKDKKIPLSEYLILEGDYKKTKKARNFKAENSLSEGDFIQYTVVPKIQFNNEENECKCSFEGSGISNHSPAFIISNPLNQISDSIIDEFENELNAK